MNVTVQAKILSIYKPKRYADRETGEFKEAGYKIQLLTVNPSTEKGTKYDLRQTSISDKLLTKYKELIGKETELTCYFGTNRNGQSYFYIVE